jgi:BASS family bile acid:Na+ symporter
MANEMLTMIKVCSAISVFAFVFSRGLGTRIDDLGYFSTRYGLMVRSFLSVDVLVPLIALAVIYIVGPSRATAIGLILLASAPVAPLVSRNISQAGGKLDYAMSLHVLLASLAVVTTPAILFLLSRATGITMNIDPMSVAESVGLSVLVPILAGVFVRRLFPALAERLIRPLEIVSSVVLALVFIIVLLFTYQLLLVPNIRSYIAMVLVVAGALAAGHLMASELPEERTTLALESAARNSGLALLIASEYAPLERALPVMIPYVLTSAIICFLYIRYRKIGQGSARPAGSG